VSWACERSFHQPGVALTFHRSRAPRPFTRPREVSERMPGVPSSELSYDLRRPTVVPSVPTGPDACRIRTRAESVRSRSIRPIERPRPPGRTV